MNTAAAHDTLLLAFKGLLLEEGLIDEKWEFGLELGEAQDWLSDILERDLVLSYDLDFFGIIQPCLRG